MRTAPENINDAFARWREQSPFRYFVTVTFLGKPAPGMALSINLHEYKSNISGKKGKKVATLFQAKSLSEEIYLRLVKAFGKRRITFESGLLRSVAYAINSLQFEFVTRAQDPTVKSYKQIERIRLSEASLLWIIALQISFPTALAHGRVLKEFRIPFRLNRNKKAQGILTNWVEKFQTDGKTLATLLNPLNKTTDAFDIELIKNFKRSSVLEIRTPDGKIDIDFPSTEAPAKYLILLAAYRSTSENSGLAWKQVCDKATGIFQVNTHPRRDRVSYKDRDGNRKTIDLSPYLEKIGNRYLLKSRFKITLR